MRSFILFITIIFTVGVLYSQPAFCQKDYEDAGKKAKEIYEKADSDIIYLDNVMKSLYYQNIQIIELLKEIKTLMKDFIEEARKPQKEE